MENKDMKAISYLYIISNKKPQPEMVTVSYSGNYKPVYAGNPVTKEKM